MGTARARIRRRQLVGIVLVASVIAPVFNVLTSQASLGSALQGVVDGVLVSLLVGGYLMFVRDGWARPWFQRLGFRADLALSSPMVLGLFLLGRGVGQVATSLDPGRFLSSFVEAHLLYALPFFAVIAVSIQFVLQMNRMIGTSVLGYFVAGVYHRPKAEERIFLFLDLAGSTQLAERLGSACYFELLRRFAVAGLLPLPLVAPAEGERRPDEHGVPRLIAPALAGRRSARGPRASRCRPGRRATMARARGQRKGTGIPGGRRPLALRGRLR
jgi:hypothetical protein